MKDTDTKEIEIDASVTEAITKSVMEGLQPQLDELKKAAQPVEKEVNKLKSDKEAVGGEVVDKFAKMSKEAFVVAQLNAALQGNNKELGELNDFAAKGLQEKGLITKATYMNAGTNADGGYLVPSAELMSDVLNMLSDFSPLAGKVRVITLTEGNSINIDSLTADVTMTEVGSEGGSKATTKPTLAQTNVALREFAGIVILTKKLLNQAAMDVYGIVRDSFARAIAKKREQLLLTDSTSGIVTVSGTVSVIAGGSSSSGKTTVDLIALKELKAMPFKVPTASANQGMYVFSRLLAGSLAGREDTTGQPIMTIDSQNGGTLTGRFNGYPYVVAETLATGGDVASTVHAVFGNFQQFAVDVRQGTLDTSVFDSGTVVDGSSVTHNLIQENKVAVRAEIWENVGYPLPGAFVKLATSAT